MILKTYTTNQSGVPSWNFYDNIENASYYFDEELQCSCVALKFRGDRAPETIKISAPAYLCNDRGQTVEKLYPGSR